MTAAMSAADHVFIEALTAMLMPVVKDSRTEVMLADIAAGAVDQVNLTIDPLCKVARAFAAWRAARKQRTRPHSETLDLNAALADFHRWRLGQAQAAMRARAA